MQSDRDLQRTLLDLPLERLLAQAAALRDEGHGELVSYSRKVFIPLTRLCRDVCHYCTFARRPRELPAAYLSPDEVLAIARAGERAGCTEALFTLGDKPELRYPAARDALHRLGHATTIDYLAAMCERVLRETSLLPHVNPGVMSAGEIARLRAVSVSQGLMLESAAERLCDKGGVHFGSPDKRPDARLATIASAGELRVPFTSGILIGIGETRAERIDALLALARLHAEHGHLQEVIVQNFRAKPDTRLAGAAEPELADLLWTIAVARIVFGPGMNIQAPPNLSGDAYPALIAAGINDWGGVSPVTPDHVNPEAPWPRIEALREGTRKAGKHLVARLPLYPAYCADAAQWIDAGLRARVIRATDADGFARDDDWSPGMAGTASAAAIAPERERGTAPPDGSSVAVRANEAALAPAECTNGAPCANGAAPTPAGPRVDGAAAAVERILARAMAGTAPSKGEIVALFRARGPAFAAVCEAADVLRRASSGDVVRYVVNRNINYTNVCGFHCRFCAFSKGRGAEDLRGRPYDLSLDEVARRAREAWARGATEVCMQGGIHPDYTGATYLALVRAVKDAVPDMHVHAFSPLEITHGAATLGLSVEIFLSRLRDAGLGTLPGTAAEILDDEVRRVICPDKLTSRQWLSVIESAHRVGLRTTATIMFGHVDAPRHWAAHLAAIRALQARTGGFTEFVPLPFVHMEAPMYRQGAARRGPTFREAVLMHAVARIALHPLIPRIQVSWVKMGPDGVRAALAAGADDLGGTLMNESISRAAGTVHGEEMPPAQMDRLIASCGRTPAQRTTLYGPVPASRQAAAHTAAPLQPLVLDAARRRAQVAASGRHAGQNPIPIESAT